MKKSKDAHVLKTRLKNDRGVFVLCGIYALISIVLFLLMTGGKVIVSSDSLSYTVPAEHILRDGFLSRDGVNPEYSRTPGYPLFLALVYFLGGTNMTVLIIQMALMTLKVYLFYRTLLLAGTPPRLALLGTTFLLINVPSYGYSFSVISEPLFGFLLLLSLYLLVKYLYCGRRYIFFLAFSLTINYALLTRPILLYFNLLLCVALLVLAVMKKVPRKCFAAFFVCWAVMFVGWSLRNYAHSSVFIFTTINNNDVARLQTPVVIAYMEGKPYIAYPGYAEGISEANEENLLLTYPELGGNDLNEAQKASYGANTDSALSKNISVRLWR
jgi:4-amino-4-deoxy-L-arabinose transferase-like glycosyltransferase